MAFPSVFPGDLDSYIPKTDGIDDVMAVDVNELQSAIEAIETKLRIGTSVPIHAIDGADHTVAGRTAGQILVATAAATFGWSAGTIVFGGTSASLSLPNAAIAMTGGATTLAFGATGRTYTFPDASGTVPVGTGASSYLAYWTTANGLTGSPTLAYTPTAAVGLSLVRTAADPVATQYNLFNVITATMTADNGQTVAAISNDGRISGAYTFSSQLYGLNNIVRAVSGAIVAGANARLAGTRSIVIVDATSSVSSGYAYRADSPAVTAGGAIAEAGGFYIAAQKVAGVTTGYGVNQIGTTDINYFGGAVGIKMLPTYTLDVTGNIRCSTGFGCNSATPQTAYSLGAASTDLATVVALANKLRLMAIANGIGTT